MPLSAEEDETLTDLLNAIEAERGVLNDWERGFFDDQLKRHEQYGSDIRLSPKQWAALRKIHEKVTGTPSVEPPPPDEEEEGEREYDP